MVWERGIITLPCEMAWLGSVRSFHATCLNSLAGALAASADVPWEKVRKLLGYCPLVSAKEEPSCVLHDRGLSAVVALGLFAVESKLQVYKERVVGYLLELVRALPRAKWIQNTLVTAKREGLIVEQFCYKLGVILGNIAAMSKEYHSEIVCALLEVFGSYAKQFTETINDNSDKLCLVVVPALLGLSRALQGTATSRREAFWHLFESGAHTSSGGEKWRQKQKEGEGEELEEWSFGDEEVKTLSSLIIDGLNPTHLKLVDTQLEGLNPTGDLFDTKKSNLSDYPYRFLGPVLQCSLITLLRDTLTGCRHDLDQSIRVQVLKLSESCITAGVHDLSAGGQSGGNERAFYIIKSISVAVELLVWGVKEDTEVESAFQRLSSLLTVHTSKFSVLVTPLRATILEGLAQLAQTSQAFVSLALNRFKEFLNSNLLYGMYSDALDSGNLDFATSEQPQSFVKLQSILQAPVHISRVDAFTHVQLALGKAVCRTLLAGSVENSECVAAFLASLGNKLYTTDAANERALRTAECIVMLLGQVAATVWEQHGVIATVVAIFQQRLFHPVCPLDGNIVIELGKMAAKTGDRGTMEVLSRLMTRSLGETYQTERESVSHIYQSVVDSLVHVARHLQDGEQRYELMMKALQVFVQQGIEAKRASEKADVQTTHKATSSSFSLGLLLPVIATLMQRVEPISKPTQKVVKLFRDFWLYCIIMGFSEAEMGVFPPVWYKHVSEIAAKSPLLLSMGAEQFLDKELEVNHPLKIENIVPGELQEARQSLVEQLGKSPELDRLVYRLTFVQCMYLHSIYRLESLRLENGTSFFPLIFNYLEDKGLQGELWVAVEMIANKLFQQFLDQMEAKPADTARDEELEQCAQLLVFKFSHIRGRIKQLADRYLTKLIDKFSHLLWSRSVIHSMLDLLQEVSLTLQTLEPIHRRAMEVKLPYLPHSITMPENAQKREKTVSYFAKRCEQILDLAVKWAPTETKAILEDYICQLSTATVGLTHHSGVSLAAAQINKHFEFNQLSKYLPTPVTAGRHSCINGSFSQSHSTLHLHSHHMGEIKGMITAAQLAAKASNESDAVILKRISAAIITELQQTLKEGTREQVTTVMYRATALLITADGLDRSLLYNISQLPVRVFTEVAIATAVDCWNWLLVKRPDLEYPFMREFAAVWKWTVEQRKGAFSSSPPKMSKMGERPPPIPVKQHSLLIEFLTARFDVVSTRNTAQVCLIAELFHQSLTLGVGPSSSQKQYFSHEPEATSARFRLLTLGVKLLQGNLISGALERTLLRERIYNTTLDFFCYPPAWPTDDIPTIRETAASLIKFWQSLKELKNTMIVSPLPSSALEVSTSLPRSSNSFWQLALSAESSPAQGSWMNTLTSGRSYRPPSIPSLSLQVPQVYSKRSSNTAKHKVLLKRRNVILALVRHEVERLSVWQNPTGLAEMTIPGEDVVTNWVNPTQSERHWRSTIIMAYHSSPHLAFQLINRFRNQDVVAKEVARLIHSDPVSFIEIPDAAQLLARKDSVLQNAPELYHLLYWCNIPPAAALTYFYKPFSHHPITAQFANKVMHSFQPDDILLYIPQLIQSVRYDKLGFAKAYILTAAKKSQLLAHQFLWNMEANMYLDEEGKQKDPEIGPVLEQLAAEIRNGLSGAALKFYEREFSFFKKVTSISGIIRPFPKPQRKAECLKALKQIAVEPGVYLPSNPDCLVLDIDYTSGKPLQSAAKAPFLAKFRVAKCGTAEVETMNTQQEDALSEQVLSRLQEQSVWQGSIFKVGDDVRQDMLALQIIQLFRDIFQEVGLALYLVPYRVVATASGCGVIECVPDSKSRDQLGKQTLVSLREYFLSVYGDEDSVTYQEARGNFIRSMAAYSLVSYLLQIKDRHNGNIMVDKHGHIIHIDFGFLFESSPGGNLGFEPDLKLTEEMLELMGGKKSDPYRWFLELCVQGYLAIRPYQEQVVPLVCLMLDTGFPCFRGNTIDELRARFRSHLGEREAAKAIVEVVESSCLNFRTFSYDVIQDVQQNIYYHKKTA